MLLILVLLYRFKGLNILIYQISEQTIPLGMKYYVIPHRRGDATHNNKRELNHCQ